jgi:hypothetical protein
MRNLRPNFNTALGILCLAWEGEDVQHLKDGFGVILYPLFNAIETKDYLYHPSKAIGLARIKTEVTQSKSDSDYNKELAERLSAWIALKDVEKPPSEPTQSKNGDKPPSEPVQSKDGNKQRRVHRPAR